MDWRKIKLELPSIELPANYNNLSTQKRLIVREQYIKLQDGKCHYCKCPLNESPPDHIKQKPINTNLFPVNFFKYPIHLHHNHVSGITIGAVHNLCNAVLWQYEKE